MSWIMRFLSSDIVIPFRVWGPRNSSHNGRKSKGITPECFDVRPLPCPHNPPRPLPPSRGEAASSNSLSQFNELGRLGIYKTELAGTCFQLDSCAVQIHSPRSLLAARMDRVRPKVPPGELP